MQEKRRFVRFKVPFCAKLKIDDQSEELCAVTRDISYAGVRLIIDTAQKLSLNPPVYLDIIFPEESIKLCAKPVWLKEYPGQKQEAGFSFIKPPETYKDIIYKYIFKYTPQELTHRWWQE